MKTALRFFFCTIVLFLSIGPLEAHTINYEMEIRPVSDVVTFYLGLGFKHIIPYGLDHILFILCLFLLDSNLKSLVLQATCFTLAHCFTLILTAGGIIIPPAALIEPLIALSIVFVAMENIIKGKISLSRYALVFFFGLIHGMGFANALNETGLPRNAFFSSLIAFNAGVELGQLSIILVAWLMVGKLFAEKNWYRSRVVVPASVCIALIAFIWTIERVVQLWT